MTDKTSNTIANSCKDTTPEPICHEVKIESISIEIIETGSSDAQDTHTSRRIIHRDCRPLWLVLLQIMFTSTIVVCLCFQDSLNHPYIGIGMGVVGMVSSFLYTWNIKTLDRISPLREVTRAKRPPRKGNGDTICTIAGTVFIISFTVGLIDFGLGYHFCITIGTLAVSGVAALVYLLRWDKLIPNDGWLPWWW